jgi:hypothetical protein
MDSTNAHLAKRIKETLDSSRAVSWLLRGPVMKWLGKSLFQTLNSYRFGEMNPELKIPVVCTLNYEIPV